MPELGTVLGIRFVVALATLFGRRLAGAFLAVLATYYALASGRVRRASRTFLRRAGADASLPSVVRHVRFFARVALDRFFFLRGRFGPFAVERVGHEHIMRLARDKRGALLLGSHLGSFEAMRAVAADYDVPLNVVADFANAERVNGVLAQLAPNHGVRLIALDPTRADSALAIRDCIQRGELVAILGDRTVAVAPQAKAASRNVTVDFLGAPAELPMGPYLLAHVLDCPVYLVFCLFEEPNRYVLHCEPFADSIRLARSDRAASAQEHAQRYADRLAHYARLAPYNWFNFYDFWLERTPE